MHEVSGEPTRPLPAFNPNGVVVTVEELAEYAQRFRFGIPADVLRDLLFAIEDRHLKAGHEERFLSPPR